MFFAKKDWFPTLKGPGVTLVPAGKPEASRYGAGLVSLKGKMFYLFARALVAQGESLWKEVLRDPSPATVTRALEAGRQP